MGPLVHDNFTLQRLAYLLEQVLHESTHQAITVCVRHCPHDV